MLARILSTTAVSALTLAIAACSPSAPTTAAAEPATQVAAPPTMEAQPVSMAAATPAAAADMSGMDHSAHAMVPAEAANPGVAPVPSSPSSPLLKDKQPVNAAAAATGHTLPINKIKNFKLADQNGKAYELYKMTDAKAIVLTGDEGCPIGQQLQPDFKDMQAKMSPRARGSRRRTTSTLTTRQQRSQKK